MANTGPNSSGLKRYAPFIAIVVVVGVVIAVLAATSSSDKKPAATTQTTSPTAAKGDIITYNEAKAAGTLGKYTWSDTCNTTTGLVQLSEFNAPPCVPKFTGNNGGNTSPGVTADTIKVAYYVAKVDPIGDGFAKTIGGYDSPSDIAKTIKGYGEIFSKATELYGRKIEFLPLQGSGASTDETAAQADAEKAKSMGVFAVIGGPSQTRSFSSTLAKDKILCIGTCLLSQPEAYYKANSPYIYPGISPDQTHQFTTEFVVKQLKGKNADFAGDEFKGKPRTYAILSYDTKDGQYKASLDQWQSDFEAQGVHIIGRKDYFLDVNTVQADAATIIQKLKEFNATTVIYTGELFSPRYFTAEATKQKYFPEWVISGTVLADTAIAARSFDQEQWKHAFGLGLVPARTPRVEGAPYQIYECGLGIKPPADNTQGIELANANVLFNGLTLAGPKLTADAFHDGLFGQAPAPRDEPGHLRSVSSYGDHGIWKNGTDYGSTDDTSIIFWDPKATGEDETGNDGVGEYRYFENGKRYRPGEIPSDVKLFDPTNTVTYYADGGPAGTKPVPDALKPPPCKK